MSYDSKYLPFILDRKPKTKSPDELERLVTSFNTMRENLAKDIKGRELAEEELRQNERIVSTSADMLALLNKDFIYLAANDAYVKEFNKSQDEIVGHTVSEVFGEEFFETVIKDNATRCMNGEVINFQDWFDFPLSGRCFMDITYYPYYNSENDITGFVVSGRDITDRKKSDQALTESEEKLNLIINTSPIGICTVDQLGNFITTNPVYERMVGHSKEECRSLSFFDVTHPDDRPKNKKLFQSMFSLEATGFSMKKRYIHKDGSVIDVDVHAVGIMDADGKIRFGTAFVNDITDNKIKEKEIEDKSRELENQFDKSEKQRIATLSVLTDLNASSKKLREEITERINAENKLKAINQQLTANEQQLKANEEEIKINLKEKIVLIQEIYHRTKNNMAVISSMLSMQSRRSDNEFVNTTFKEIINKIKAMSLVHQKLYQSKNLSNIDFKEYVEDLAKLLMQSFGAESRKIDSKLELENVNILIDSAIPLGLILNELVSNIFKHAFPNKKDGKIFIRLFKDDDNIINLQLSDNGIGLPHNFDIRKDGSMGLSSVFSLVERQLKGSISAKSENGLKWHIKINDSLHQERV
ncbi:MAG: PAS domain S-box protein [Candidatus Cloacimonetes bacterium]|nr:PAS domain S-box protein [Candidatus Cloacimonadota bacterium]